jgi:hypothetical protein
MNEPTLTPAAEEVVPVPVPVQLAALEPALEPADKPLPEPRVSPPSPSEDQLPTTRVQSIAVPLPPPVPPQGPAHKTQPLRAITRDDAEARLAVEAKRRRWQTVLSQVKRAAAGVPSPLAVLRGEAWTERRVGLACATVGVAMIGCALVLGWQSVASDRFVKVEHVSLAVAVVLARAAIAIAAMLVGYGLLRVGERTLLAFPERGLGRRSDFGARER